MFENPKQKRLIAWVLAALMALTRARAFKILVKRGKIC